MKLIFKLPANKCPFIGILFSNEELFKGEKLHAEIVEKYGHCTYTITLEQTTSNLNLRLICQETVSVYFYDHLDFDYEKLKSWLYLTKNHKEFTFGHVCSTLDKHIIITSQPGRKKFFVKVNGLNFLTEEDPDSEWRVPFTTNNRKW